MARSSSLHWTRRIRYHIYINILLIYKYQPDTIFQIPDDAISSPDSDDGISGPDSDNGISGPDKVDSNRGPDSDDSFGTGSLVLISLGVIVLVGLLIAFVFKIRPDEHFKKWWENRSHTGIDYSAEDSL